MRRVLQPTLILGLALALSACGGEEEEQTTKRPSGTLISTAQASSRIVDVVERSVGRIESKGSPKLAAEVAGQVTNIKIDVGQKVEAGQVLATIDDVDYRNQLTAASAEVNRVETMLANQQRLVKRYQNLKKDDFVSERQIEDVLAQEAVLKSQLKSVKARRDIAERNMEKAIVKAPVSGLIQSRNVTVGDYVRPGTPLFEISTQDKLQVRLPFPEAISKRLSPGLPVKLSTNIEGGGVVEGVISEILPNIGSTSLSTDVLVDVENPGNWKPGASVNGVIILEQRENVIIPEIAVVLRPAGKVVYEVSGNNVSQRVVTTGVRINDDIEILSGLSEGAVVATDGAYYLSDGAEIRIKEEQ